jgi:hypothetical protein
MFLNGKTAIVVNGKVTRVCGSRFNAALRSGKLDVRLPTGEKVEPCKPWNVVAQAVRAGKKAQAKTG